MAGGAAWPVVTLGLAATPSQGVAHEVMAWIVVGDVLCVRSLRGPKGSGWPDLTRTGEGVIRVGRPRIPVRAEMVKGRAPCARVPRETQEKHTRPVASAMAMVRKDVLALSAGTLPVRTDGCRMAPL